MIRKSLIASAVILCGTVAFNSVAKAGSADVHFTANVPSSCTFSNVTNGTLGLNVAGTTLSSIASGTAGSATLTMRLAPGTYRLDLDPAGFPPDWQAAVNTYAVDVVAGSYTPVLVPLIKSYTISDIVMDAEGKPLSGARVEAVRTTSKQRLFSVTNEAGVYYLEHIQEGNYVLYINGQQAAPHSVELNSVSEAFQELNLQFGVNSFTNKVGILTK